MIFVGFMANPDYVGDDFAGIFYGGSIKFLGYQFWGMFIYSLWTLVTSGAMFYFLNKIGWFRVHEECEMLGMDKSHHGGSSYPLDDEHMAATERNETPEGSESGK